MIVRLPGVKIMLVVVTIIVVVDTIVLTVITAVVAIVLATMVAIVVAAVVSSVAVNIVFNDKDALVKIGGLFQLLMSRYKRLYQDPYLHNITRTKMCFFL
jgi:hypothetical protein